MNLNFAMIGGDLRMIKLAEILAKEGNKVNLYGLEEAKELQNRKNIIFCRDWKETMEDVEIVLGPIPFSKDGKQINSPFSEKIISVQEFLDHTKNKICIVGNFKFSHKELTKEQEEIIDVMKREELTVLNAISTAEGAIELVMHHTDRTIQGSKVLIIGFGRIGKVLAKKLVGLSAHVTCTARKEEDLAWIKAYGYQERNSNALGENLSEYDVIINTVPHLILTTERLEYVRKDCLLMDLASAPGGMDQQTVKERKLNYIWALALPGKVAPVTSAEFIKDTIDHVIKELIDKEKIKCY